jgi:hypothetical protein
MALKLVQAVLELSVNQSLHNDSAWFRHPEVPAWFNDIIFQVAFLGDPQGATLAADHITTSVTFYAPHFVFSKGDLSEGV